MNIVRRLLQRNHPLPGQTRKIRGLSTAELVGIIVIVGILGALGGTYVHGLVDQANLNTGTQNANTLNSTLSSAFAAGAVVGTPGCSAQGGTPNTIDTTSAATALADLNFGVVVNGVTYKMTPQVTLNNGNYILNGAGATATFSFAGAGYSP